jgi:polysaccharide export outer membrane protein
MLSTKHFMKNRFVGILLLIVMMSCASKKDILYLQDADENTQTKIIYQTPTIQPNDILKISVETLVPEAAVPYNRGSGSGAIQNSIELLKLEGYLVSDESTINFPNIGKIEVANLTTEEVEMKIKRVLEDGGYLKNPAVTVRVINAKVTVLGEVNSPGTFTFTEQNITILQALGYAGDLTINGKRDDIIITRDVNGSRIISHIDLTSTNFMTSEFYFLKPNDNIIVNPNAPKVKQSGFIGNVGTALTVVSLALTVTLLLTR